MMHKEGKLRNESTQKNEAIARLKRRKKKQASAPIGNESL